MSFWLGFCLVLNLWTLWVIRLVFKQNNNLSNKELLQEEDNARGLKD